MKGKHPVRALTITQKRWSMPFNSRATWSRRLAEKFVGMYVNHYTLDAGDLIPKAVAETARSRVRSRPHQPKKGKMRSKGRICQGNLANPKSRGGARVK